jgi:ipoprotein LpqH
VQNRFVVMAGTACCAVVAVACSSAPANAPQPPGSLPGSTAQITINGKSVGTTHAVHCTQDGWTHTIETGDQATGTRLVVDTGDSVSARSVVITNVGDFTGSVWENNIGNAEAMIIGTTFRVNGTAEGSNTANPNQPASATFEIKANC